MYVYMYKYIDIYEFNINILCTNTKNFALKNAIVAATWRRNRRTLKKKKDGSNHN